MPIHELIVCCTSYHLQQTSATQQRATKVSSVQCIGINSLYSYSYISWNFRWRKLVLIQVKEYMHRLRLTVKRIQSQTPFSSTCFHEVLDN